MSEQIYCLTPEELEKDFAKIFLLVPSIGSSQEGLWACPSVNEGYLTQGISCEQK